MKPEATAPQRGRKLRVPAIVFHKPSGQSVVFLRGPDGRRSMVYLGEHGSGAAEQRYREVLAEHLAGQVPCSTARKKLPRPSGWPTVATLCAEFMVHAQRYYRDAEGTLSKGVKNYEAAFVPLLAAYRETTTDQITVASLCSVRQAMADTGNYCRVTINGRLALLKQLFKWGTERRLVPGSTWHEISSVRGLAPGRSGVRENPPVEAVPWSLVEPVLAHLAPTIKAAVLVQWHAGLRPDEVLRMTRRQLTIGMEREAWIYRPVKHKGSWRGEVRIIGIGPDAQAEIRPLLKVDPDASVFSPKAAWREYRDTLRAKRTCPETQQTRRRDSRASECEPTKDFFDVSTYRRAIHRACDKAGVERWSPHRLRHAAGTRIAIKAGIESARIALGHSDTRMTRRYSVAAKEQLAAQVAMQHG